jgi:hypothetical protein
MTVDQELHHFLYAAIETKHLLRFDYKGDERIVEPHDYGIQSGIERLLCWQVGGKSGSSIPGWRLIDIDGIRNYEMLDRKFNGGRDIPSGNHHRWEKLFIRVEGSSKR